MYLTIVLYGYLKKKQTQNDCNSAKLMGAIQFSMESIFLFSMYTLVEITLYP